MRKVLIANRGEIAVRIARACRDAGIASVAVYAEPDLHCPHVRVADEAIALGGTTPGQSYLDIGKLLAAAEKTGADGVHPGYGFLAENAEFAEAVISAGLTWIGPSPQAIRTLGDKVAARHIAADVGAPLVPGTSDPVSGPGEVVAFAKEHGLPIAIKAAFGGGGRGLKVAREMDEIEELFASAVREAEQAFGRGECFVERFLDKPRHVEVQVIADSHGNVAIVGDRDCSLQRRNQKLVEEAPAPFLTEAQRTTLHDAARRICAEANYTNAGTVEFLVGQDGTVTFLEVNTRLQVEHPVTEETTGIDLVREQFRVADGELLSIPLDPVPRGHAIEFRINAEDAGRNFLPAPGTVADWQPPSGPGVRLDAGVEKGFLVPQAFDSMLAKLIVVGATREQAIERSRRALAEFVVDGMPTVIPFHQAVLREPAFVASDGDFGVHTRWIETEFNNTIEPYAGMQDDEPDPEPREHVVVEVGGRRLEVVLPASLGAGAATGAAVKRAPRRAGGSKAGLVASGDSLTSPMQGTIVKVAVEDGQQVTAGELIVVLEAMKMEQPLNAHKDGVISSLVAEVGQTVSSGAVICDIKSAD
ncbi:MAG: acetyl/propionyl/methylcrotonyl-CoA carboxylase subunit alpha [Actinomycetes bacterium]